MKGIIIIVCFLLIIFGGLCFLQLRADSKEGNSRPDSTFMQYMVVIGGIALITFLILI